MSPNGRMALINNDQLLYLPDSNDQIHLYLEEFNTWHIFESDVPSHMISVDKAKYMYKMDKNKEIWEYNAAKSKWINLSVDGNPDSDSSNTQSIMASDSHLYQLQVDGSIWVYDAPAGRWETLDPKSRPKHSIAADSVNLYQLRANGEVWRYNGPRVQGWTMIDSNNDSNSLVAGAGEVYLTHDDGSVYQYQAREQAWNRIGKNTETLQIAVGRAGLFQRQEDKIYKYHGNTGIWTIVLNDRTEDLVVGNSTIYVKHQGGRVSRYRDGAWFKLPPLPSTSGIFKSVRLVG